MFKSILAVAAFFSVTQALAEAPRFACSGTEPFWSLYINASQITLIDPMNEVATRTRHSVVPFSSPQNSVGIDYIYQTTTLPQNTPTTIVVSKQQCSDGMSDNIYPFSSLYISGSVILKGCCWKNN